MPSVIDVSYYVDTSALVKLVVVEQETPALRSWLEAEPRALITCDLSRTELLRAVRRLAPNQTTRARAVLSDIDIFGMPTALFEDASRVDPEILRSLDALHLAAALDLGDDLDGIVTYDDRLADAARSNGVRVETPR